MGERNNRTHWERGALPPGWGDTRPPAWIKPAEMGADLEATQIQRLVSEYKRPAGGCLIILAGIGGTAVLCRTISAIPEVVRFVQAQLGK